MATDTKIVFELKISDVLKGGYNSTITLTTYNDILGPSITIGKHYIIFLYGNNRIDFCGVTIELGNISTIKKLKNHLKSDGYFDEYTTKNLQYLLEVSSNQN